VTNSLFTFILLNNPLTKVIWTLSIVSVQLKHDVSETGFCSVIRQNLPCWTQSIELVPICSGHRASPYLLTGTGTSSIVWVQQSRFRLLTETESSLRNVVF
jgi:hypothetical protein